MAVLVLGAGFFWWRTRSDSGEKLEVGSSDIEVKLDLDFLESEMVKGRARYADFPIEIPEKGRDNPFEPY